MTDPKPPSGPRARAEAVFSASQVRDEAIKQEIVREREKVDAKTAKLRALRLAKEVADREAGIAFIPEVQSKRVRKKKA